VVRYIAVEWAEHLDAIASQKRGNTDTSDAIQRSEYHRVVEENQLGRCGEEGREREGEGGKGDCLWSCGYGTGWVEFCQSRRAPWDGSFEVDEQFG